MKQIKKTKLNKKTKEILDELNKKEEKPSPLTKEERFKKQCLKIHLDNHKRAKLEHKILPVGPFQRQNFPLLTNVPIKKKEYFIRVNCFIILHFWLDEENNQCKEEHFYPSNFLTEQYKEKDNNTDSLDYRLYKQLHKTGKGSCVLSRTKQLKTKLKKRKTNADKKSKRKHTTLRR